MIAWWCFQTFSCPMNELAVSTYDFMFTPLSSCVISQWTWMGPQLKDNYSLFSSCAKQMNQITGVKRIKPTHILQMPSLLYFLLGESKSSTEMITGIKWRTVTGHQNSPFKHNYAIMYTTGHYQPALKAI